MVLAVQMGFEGAPEQRIEGECGGGGGVGQSACFFSWQLRRKPPRKFVTKATPGPEPDAH